MTTIRELVEAWRTAGPQATVEPAASEAKIREAEAALGIALPPGLRGFYALADGAMLDNGWAVHPLLGSKVEYKDPFTGQMKVSTNPGLVNDRLSAFDDELERHESLLFFGNNGCGMRFGLWMPPPGESRGQGCVVAVGDCDLELSDLAARSFEEWCTTALLVNLDLLVQTGEAPADGLARFGITSPDAQERRKLLKERLDAVTYGACDPYAGGRSFERVRSMLG